MKVAYLAGPFRGANSWEIECNIRRAEALALQVWHADVACICPHANTRFYQGAALDTVWLDGDLEILKRCDAVVTTPNWSQSRGAKQEVKHALELSIPVFHAYTALDGEDILPVSFYTWSHE